MQISGTSNICAHRITWRYFSGDVKAGLHPADKGELPESEEEHIQSLLNQGCNQGELCYNWHDSNRKKDYELRGWWEIA